MNIAFKIMAYIFLVNLSAGIMSVALPDVPQQITYSETFSKGINNSFSGELAPEGVGDPASFGDRVLDFLTLGFYEKIKNLLSTYLFGVTNILEKIFGSNFTPYKAFFNWMIFLSYVLGLISLWVGRSFNK